MKPGPRQTLTLRCLSLTQWRSAKDVYRRIKAAVNDAEMDALMTSYLLDRLCRGKLARRKVAIAEDMTTVRVYQIRRQGAEFLASLQG